MKFLVIGETCSDRFCYGKSERLCPEAPAPVFVPENGVDNLGMATNVYRNLIALDEDTHKDIPYKNQIDLFTNESDGHKTRYVDTQSNQMLLRVDTDSYPYCGELPSNIEDYDAVVVSDYNKGFLKESDLREIGNRSKLSFLDTKKRFNVEWADAFTFIKINEKEYLENGWKHLAQNVIVTKASKGCWYNNKDYPIKSPSEVRDVSGAGDTFLAALSYAYAATKNIETAILLAQDCCQKVIRKKGVATI
jgi:D-beta-D-heptose 7-phosphate kinase/D-beta-D-heptose 1-phosphate adenosyltransferase|tara:strand:+ start:892 stop:1638 length:747 start_codon:yes stop_codon:yes gene_type:complete